MQSAMSGGQSQSKRKRDWNNSGGWHGDWHAGWRDYGQEEQWRGGNSDWWSGGWYAWQQGYTQASWEHRSQEGAASSHEQRHGASSTWQRAKAVPSTSTWQEIFNIGAAAGTEKEPSDEVLVCVMTNYRQQWIDKFAFRLQQGGIPNLDPQKLTAEMFVAEIHHPSPVQTQGRRRDATCFVLCAVFEADVSHNEPHVSCVDVEIGENEKVGCAFVRGTQLKDWELTPTDKSPPCTPFSGSN